MPPTSPVHATTVIARFSDDRRFLLLTFSDEQGGKTTVSLLPGELAGLVVNLKRLQETISEAVDLENAGPEGPGG